MEIATIKYSREQKADLNKQMMIRLKNSTRRIGSAFYRLRYVQSTTNHPVL